MHSIKTISELTGVRPATLRAWERRYGVPRPDPAQPGRRAYSEIEVERLVRIARLADAGWPVRDIAGLSVEDLDRRIGKLETRGEDAAADALRARLRAAIDAHDFGAYRRGVGEALTALRAVDAAEHVIAPTLRGIGDRSAEGREPAGVEHVLIALTRQMILTHSGPHAWRGGGHTVAFTTLPGDPHEIGCMLAWHIAVSAGCNAVYLGVNLAIAKCAEAARLIAADALVVCGAHPPRRSSLTEAARVLDASVDPRTRVWLGAPPDDPVHEAADLSSRVMSFASLRMFDVALDLACAPEHMNATSQIRAARRLA